MSDTDLAIRRANEQDLAAVGRLGALLLRAHHGFDPLRFMTPRSDPESGYAWFLGTQLADEDTLILVADRGGAICGYLYATIEPQSWKELREEAGFIQDVVVDERSRGSGVATSLIEQAADWFRSRGMARMILWTAQANQPAQHLFDRLGFRRTMIEMTREI
jgi:ribosomal protein S18 acetylase RimI-like enzyme